MTDNPTDPILPEPGVLRNSAERPDPGQDRQYEGATSNPTGRVESDKGAKRTAPLLRCKVKTIISTFNANTIRLLPRYTELASQASSYEISILGIQEHRHVYPDEEIEGMHLITSSAWREPTTMSAQGGVGLMLNSKAKKALRGVVSVSDRILTAEFDGNPATSVIICYSPHNSSEEKEVEAFDSKLHQAVTSILAHNFLAVLGNFNAQVRLEDIPYSYQDFTNRNGQYLVDFIQEHSLIAANTQFKKQAGKLWTYENRASIYRKQLIYILVRTKWRNCAINTEAYSTFNSVSSDHRVVSMQVRLSPWEPTATGSKEKIDWKAFSSQPVLQAQYTVEGQAPNDLLTRYGRRLYEHPHLLSTDVFASQFYFSGLLAFSCQPPRISNAHLDKAMSIGQHL
ncbi:uncharacterized protein LOC134359115 [Mobula hypostoma]|uniref:uncharacterized protein LOC134359115 n=1 Tax=Mobula hypostoma TaxID=723540 RepID=UPI002FC30A09